jgi:hypothetical protein
MPSKILPLAKLKQPDPLNSSRRSEELERAASLVQRLLAFPAASAKETRSPNRRLVNVASALLKSLVLFGERFGSDFCDSCSQRILLLVYLRQGQSGHLSPQSLYDSPTLGPTAVTLRWTIKLLGDGVLELVVTPEPDERLIRLNSTALDRLEGWLSDVDLELNDRS